MPAVWIGWERPPLHPVRPAADTLPQIVGPCHTLGHLRLRSGVVVRELYPQLAGVFPFAVQTLPEVALPSAG